MENFDIQKTWKCRHEIINHFIEKFDFKKYLEIGYKAGATFRLVNCENKTAIDPLPENNEFSINIHKCTSDIFFEYNKEKFDIVFIDGLHVYEQVKKDFENSVKCLNEGGVIIFHDMNPKDTICKDGQIIKGEVRAKEFKDGGCYNGDCFKLAIDFYNGEYDYKYYTFDFDEGCMVVFPNEKIYNSKKEVIKKEYINFAKKRDEILNII